MTLRCTRSLSSRDRGGSAIRAGVLVATARCLGLAVYGLVRYPGLRGGPGQWLAVALLAVLLAGYALGGLALCRGVAPHSVKARARALLGEVGVGAAWLLILAPDTIGKQLIFVPLLAALVVPAGVSFLATRATGDARLATGAGLWSGMIGGLLVIIPLVALALGSLVARLSASTAGERTRAAS